MMIDSSAATLGRLSEMPLRNLAASQPEAVAVGVMWYAI